MKIYKRENYLKKIRGFYHDTGLIKVITGVRRCGKSCLMHSIAEELESQGIASTNIVFINLDVLGYRSIKTADRLEETIKKLCVGCGTKYLFIDEIQNVPGFEEVINGFREEGGYSIFITGSNSYLLSGDLVTKLTGRYLEFEVFPLTFDEYLGMKTFLGQAVSEDPFREFDNYLADGGFPKALEYSSFDDKREYVEGIVREIFEKDVKKRIKVRDVSAFEKVRQYLINNFGTITSLTNILSDLHKAGESISRRTLGRYIQILVDAKILCRCQRFDLKSRKFVGGEEKYYLADLSFYFATNTDNRINYGPALENIVYIYARSKGYSVSVGRIGKLECDFILRRRNGEYSYAQVAMTMQNDRATEDREYRPLEAIRDNYPKYVCTRNDLIQHRNGIIHVNLAPFMKEGSLF